MRPVLTAVLLAATAACAGAPAGAGSPAPEQLYRQKCSGCHRPYEPSTRTRAQWDAALERMAPKAHLSPEQAATLQHWLAAHASDAEGAR